MEGSAVQSQRNTANYSSNGINMSMWEYSELWATQCNIHNVHVQVLTMEQLTSMFKHHISLTIHFLWSADRSWPFTWQLHNISVCYKLKEYTNKGQWGVHSFTQIKNLQPQLELCSWRNGILSIQFLIVTGEACKSTCVVVH